MNFLYDLLPNYLNLEEKKKIWIAIAVLVASTYMAIGVLFTPGTDPSQCGDYTLKDGRYEYTEGRGDYDKEGTSYFYVGCKRSAGGWFFGFTGSGSGYRGGGPGAGK